MATLHLCGQEKKMFLLFCLSHVKKRNNLDT